MKNADLPAMPISEEETDRVDAGVKVYTGLTKREMFAMAAMQGLLANEHALQRGIEFQAKCPLSEQAVNMADALLDALERTK